MTSIVYAEALVMSKRLSTRILLGIWAVLALVFAFVVPYITYLNDPQRQPLSDVLPANLVGNLMGGFPFFGGVIALMLGVLTFGSEYGTGTLKTLFTQRPGRLHVFGAKLIALALALVPFVLVVYGLGVAASYGIALREGASTAAPSAWLLLRGLGAGWLILVVWATLGVLFAVISRGTALAIGIGILYALVIEGLLSALASQISVVDRIVQFFMRANAYSLVAKLGVSPSDVANNGPGSFEGPFVSATQALVVLAVYMAVFLAASGWLLRRRDVA